MDFRVGFGYDVHQFAEGRDLILGGIKIPYEKGLLGHSDADVLLHALTDALLGALALGDIGSHFPDNDPEYKDADSKVLLLKVYSLISQKGYKLVNMDSTVVAEEPKLKEYVDRMRESIAMSLECSADQVSVKATTNEKMGFTGRKEGIAAYAVVMLKAN